MTDDDGDDDDDDDDDNNDDDEEDENNDGDKNSGDIGHGCHERLRSRCSSLQDPTFIGYIRLSWVSQTD